MKKSDDARAYIIGIPISAVNMESCINYIKNYFENAKGNYICVSNVHTTVMAHDDPIYRKIQEEAFLILPDGKPLSVIGKFRYPEMDRVTGPDFMRRIFQESKQEGYRHFFYGNTQDQLDKLLKTLKKEYPWLVISGSEPSVFRDMTEEEEAQLIQRINKTNPDFIWVALGAPRQEKFCYRLRGKTTGLMVGVGGAFNVLAHIVPEAPQWVQNISMEWFYRLLQEPGRLFKRYFITNNKFIYYLITNHKPKL